MVLLLDNEFFEEIEKAGEAGVEEVDDDVPRPTPPPPPSHPAWWQQLEQMTDEEVCRHLAELEVVQQAAPRHEQLTPPAPSFARSAGGKASPDPGRLIELARWMKAHGRHMLPTSIDPELVKALRGLVSTVQREGGIEIGALTKGLRSAGFESTAKAIKARAEKAGAPSTLRIDEVVQWMAEAVLDDRAEQRSDHKWRIHSLGSASHYASAIAVRCEVEGAFEASAKRVLEVPQLSVARRHSLTSVFDRLSVGRVANGADSSKQARARLLAEAIRTAPQHISEGAAKSPPRCTFRGELAGPSRTDSSLPEPQRRSTSFKLSRASSAASAYKRSSTPPSTSAPAPTASSPSASPLPARTLALRSSACSAASSSKHARAKQALKPRRPKASSSYFYQTYEDTTSIYGEVKQLRELQAAAREQLPPKKARVYREQPPSVVVQQACQTRREQPEKVLTAVPNAHSHSLHRSAAFKPTVGVSEAVWDAGIRKAAMEKWSMMRDELLEAPMPSEEERSRQFAKPPMPLGLAESAHGPMPSASAPQLPTLNAARSCSRERTACCYMGNTAIKGTKVAKNIPRARVGKYA
ncbi:hypothetical protein AB1Y20_017671 [Prymnesium parvum]|uniref:Uncharacterized protein n=1 Tax=Prymnesium parvum TaxID=97485 RepID=A0AB34JLW8_PRYPA